MTLKISNMSERSYVEAIFANDVVKKPWRGLLRIFKGF